MASIQEALNSPQNKFPFDFWILSHAPVFPLSFDILLTYITNFNTLITNILF